MTSTTANPYASPESTSDPFSDAAREIGIVVRVFRWIGWVGTVLYLPMTVATGGALIYSLIAEPIDSPLVLGGALLVNGGVLFISITFLRTAKGLRNKHPLSRRASTVLSCVLLLGFPFFTIVGAICLYKVRRNFSVYCEGTV